MGKSSSYVIWFLIELVSIFFTLGGVILVFSYWNSEDVAQNGFSIDNFITDSGVGLFLLGFVMYAVSRGAKKKIRKNIVPMIQGRTKGFDF